VEVESTTRSAKERVAGFEGREGHRTPFAPVARIPAKERTDCLVAASRSYHDADAGLAFYSRWGRWKNCVPIYGDALRSHCLRRFAQPGELSAHLPQMQCPHAIIGPSSDDFRGLRSKGVTARFQFGVHLRRIRFLMAVVVSVGFGNPCSALQTVA
jgi:hypothetical protein